MNITTLAILGMGAGLILVGLGIRRNKPNKNWKALVAGGITMMIIGVVMICFGWK
jgi:hypothetical protein